MIRAVLVLASGSPRRRELLGQLGVAFAVRVADVDETPLPGEDADALVRRLAVAKAEAVMAASPEDHVVVLGADTVVSVGGDVLGKPVDPAHAATMLRKLSGTRHQVLTAVAVCRRSPAGMIAPDRTTSRRADDGGGPTDLVAAVLGGAASIAVEVVVTDVHMAELSGADIDAYVATGEPMDKAGSYAIQEVGDRFVRAIEGPFDNVVGLPLTTVRRLITDAGVDLGGGQPPLV